MQQWIIPKLLRFVPNDERLCGYVDGGTIKRKNTRAIGVVRGEMILKQRNEQVEGLPPHQQCNERDDHENEIVLLRRNRGNDGTLLSYNVCIRNTEINLR